MGESLGTALGRCVLAVTSGFGLVECYEMKYIRVAFGLYLVDGVIGVVEYVLPKRNNYVTKAKNFMDRISRPCYTPLVAAECFLFAGMEEKFCLCHLIFPVGYLLLTELLKKNVNRDLVDLSTILHSVSIFFSAFKKEDYLYGGITGLMNIISFLGMQFNTMEYFLSIAVTNLAAVQFLKQSLIK